MTHRPPGSAASRILRALLRLYPASHRAQYGEEMMVAAAHRRAGAGGGVWSMVAAALDLVVGAAGVWRDRLGRTTTMRTTTRGLGLDVRFVARSLWRSRGYAITAIVVLACAVAVNATVFSYVRGTLLAKPPYPEPERVTIVWGSNVASGQLRDVVSGATYFDLQDRVTTLDPIAAFDHDGAYLLVDGRPVVFDALGVSVDFLAVLGVEPAMGRFFDERDRMSGGAASVVVTHAFWRDRMGADPEALGSTLPFEDGARTVIGVLPEGFEFISPVPLFLPLHDDVLAADGRTSIHYHVLGRLAIGATLTDVNRELGSAAADLVASYPELEGWGFLAEPLHRVSVEAVRPVILVLTTTVALVLLVALLNLATLFRIRALTRGTELGVRVALGAGRGALVRVLFVETAGLAAVGAAFGLLAAPFLLDAVSGLLPVWIAIPESAARVPVLLASFDPWVAVVAFGGAVVGSLLLTAPSFVVALRSADVAHASGTRVRGGVRSARTLVGVELALATVLCIGAALTVRTASNLLSEDVGIEPDGLLTLYYGDVWDRTPDARVAYFREVAAAVEAIPGVERAGVMGYVDFQSEDDFAGVEFLDRTFQPVRRTREEWRRVDEGLFEALGVRIVAGRGFEPDDFRGRPRAIVINESFAAEHYPDRSPLGERLSLHEVAYRELEIVGVAADVRSLGPAARPPAMIYAPYQGAARGGQGLHVRVSGDPMAYADAVREAIWSVDPSQPIYGVAPMRDLVDAWVAIPKATRALVLGLAGLAWLLSAVGVFGVVAYTVRTRRAEMGIRLALGASPDRLEADQMRAISPVVVTGVGVGVLAGVAAAGAARAVLYGVSPADPVSLLAATAVMVGAALVATHLPARRASRIDPSEVIRAQ